MCRATVPLSMLWLPLGCSSDSHIPRESSMRGLPSTTPPARKHTSPDALAATPGEQAPAALGDLMEHTTSRRTAAAVFRRVSSVMRERRTSAPFARRMSTADHCTSKPSGHARESASPANIFTSPWSPKSCRGLRSVRLQLLAVTRWPDWSTTSKTSCQPRSASRALKDDGTGPRTISRFRWSPMTLLVPGSAQASDANTSWPFNTTGSPLRSRCTAAGAGLATGAASSSVKPTPVCDAAPRCSQRFHTVAPREA
mmetsp:Transcript_77061/g.223626  ORF Transcript_77061/g.223626 Transcript_77061/m.223626 type:complete len:255 (+) Transcript_77061:700-1464(+)